MEQDLYSVLGVSKDASQDEIKQAYRKLAKKWHPDRFSGKSESERKNAEEKFKAISTAYDTLGDEQKRKEYDNPLGGDFGDFGGFSPFGGFPGGFSFSFGGGNGFGGFGQNTGSDEEVVFNVSLKDIYEGTQNKVFTFKKSVRCEDCGGSGKSDWHECPHCNGKGKFVEQHRTFNGISMTTRICSHCGGTGGYGSGTCKSCHGTGLERKDSSVEVEIKREWIVQDGVTVNVEGMGSEAKTKGTPNGNLHVKINHTFDKNRYKVDKYNIWEQIEVNVLDALRGCEKTIVLPDNTKVKINIPECTDNGNIITINNKGIKIDTNRRGNYYVCVKLKMPQSLSKDQRKILQKL